MITIEPESKTVATEHLGEFQVLGLPYSDRMRLIENDDQTAFMLTLLHLSAIDAEGNHYERDQWDVVAGRYTSDVLEVFKGACEVNGFAPEVIEGNSDAQS